MSAPLPVACFASQPRATNGGKTPWPVPEVPAIMAARQPGGLRPRQGWTRTHRGTSRRVWYDYKSRKENRHVDAFQEFDHAQSQRREQANGGCALDNIA